MQKIVMNEILNGIVADFYQRIEIFDVLHLNDDDL